MVARHLVAFYHYQLKFKLSMDSKLQCAVGWSVQPLHLHSPVATGAGYCIINQIMRVLQSFEAGKFRITESVKDADCVQRPLAPCVRPLSKYDELSL